MPDLVVTRYTILPADEVLVRAVQFFTNENWRAQSQTNRIATFVGVAKIRFVHLMVAVLLTFFFVIPGLIYYLMVIRKARQLKNLVVTTSPKEAGCDVVVTYPPDAQRYVDAFCAALPEGAAQLGTTIHCTQCGKEITEGSKFCTACGSSSFSPTLQAPSPPSSLRAS